MDETIAIIMLEMKIPNASGYISVCIPGNLLTNIFSIMDKRRNVESAYDNGIANSREIIMEKLRNSALDMRVQLGTAKLSFRDVYGLKVDDVIDLNKSKNSDVRLYVAGQPWYDAKLGVHKNSVAVQLDDRIVKEEIEEPATETEAQPAEEVMAE